MAIEWRWGVIAAVVTFAMAVVTFLARDMAPRDGRLVASVEPVYTGDGSYEVGFTNLSEHAVTGLNARFAFFDADGARTMSDQFTPVGMTVEPGRGKWAVFPPEASADIAESTFF